MRSDFDRRVAPNAALAADYGTRLVKHWREHKVACRPAASVATLAAFEATQGVRLPSDMRAYLLQADGTEELGDDLVEWWSVARFEAVCAGLPAEPGQKWFVFGDYLLSSHSYVIRLDATESGPTPVGTYHAYNDTRLVAKSFAEFVAGYLLGDDAVVHGKNAPQF